MVKKKTVKSSTRNVEATGYAEVGSYLYKLGDGKVRVKTHTSVNSPLKLDSAEEIKQIKKIRVETRVVEDKGIDGDVVYQKDVETIQLPDGEDSVANDTPVSVEQPNMVDKALDAFGLKNRLDKMDDTTKMLLIGLAVCGVVAISALFIALLL